VKIDINRIPPEGLALEENIQAGELDLETEQIKFRGPIRAEAGISKITNAVTVDLSLKAKMCVECGRCLEEFETAIDKNLKLNYQADKSQPIIDLNPDIREEIIVNYPMKPLCSLRCKGLCPKCGKNLNEGGCSCATT
jgi:uncharacterized protein